MGDEINTLFNESSPTMMPNGTIYFESKREENDLDIYFSVLKNGIRQKAEKIGRPVDTEASEGSPYLPPDERYMIFSSDRPGGLGELDLYVTFKKKSGEWGEPINLGNEINSTYMDWSPYITPDGKYLVFSSYRNTEPITPFDPAYYGTLMKELGLPKVGNGTLYWVDARCIEVLKPKE
jgi:Tol biopolymer transport system component